MRSPSGGRFSAWTRRGRPPISDWPSCMHGRTWCRRSGVTLGSTSGGCSGTITSPRRSRRCAVLPRRTAGMPRCEASWWTSWGRWPPRVRMGPRSVSSSMRSARSMARTNQRLVSASPNAGVGWSSWTRVMIATTPILRMGLATRSVRSRGSTPSRPRCPAPVTASRSADSSLPSLRRQTPSRSSRSAGSRSRRAASPVPAMVASRLVLNHPTPTRWRPSQAPRPHSKG